ncbi:UvrD-helicase domain-containing protein [Cellulomonas sp. PS-H5]|uniref:UvrD-helicase domain-containing protein n=1 Tax=Cellulomonas sp. PS-H5 TaxID=2820400 RepID=UPI001C4EAF91|nr:UvrD-helicase domain-containing protein [Cellulomonas sp. PS-H5]MBW0252468.1 UvrD-helicase domain-containing protein [Cellulomonas sp. PS-H5]
MSRISTPDTAADREIRAILDRTELTGFSVIAGAGSGKTTSLVKALAYVTRTRGPLLLAKKQRVACITYTEIAAREIRDEIGNDPLAFVSTIHSFLWHLVKPFQADVAVWVAARIVEQIDQILEKQEQYTARTRDSTKERDAQDLVKRQRQREAIVNVSRWTYGIGSDYARGVVGHADVIKMVPELIIERPMLARLLARQFPFVLVDESQDTFFEVVRALKHSWSLAGGKMCLGFFGDPMQQIYQQGVGAVSHEEGWVRVDKPQNFRSSRRVLECVNAVRADGDALEQISGRENQPEGDAYCFVLPSDEKRSERLESVRVWLDRNSGQGNWTRGAHDGGAKILMIVHRMAARRLGFGALYAAFSDNKANSLDQAFSEGVAWPLAPFRDVILPLCQSESASSPELVGVLRDKSPAFQRGLAAGHAKSALASSRAAVKDLRRMSENPETATLGELIRFAADRAIVELDPRLAAYLYPGGDQDDIVLEPETLAVLDAMSKCSLSELVGYYKYINQQSPYSTQHGTKGAEFDRVIVVLDDEEGKFSLYSYEKLFGISELSPTDVANQAAGSDSAVERTRRLLYVCVSRARLALSIVLFAPNVKLASESLRASSLGATLKFVHGGDLDLPM